MRTGQRERVREAEEERGIKTTVAIRTAPKVFAVGSGSWALPFPVHC